MTVLGDVLEFAGVPERITDPARERFVTVRLNSGGAVERSIGSGKTPVAFTGYRVKQGQFIYSRIDARNGAFAIIPAELDRAVVSKDFPIFDIRADRVVDRYLSHFFRSGRLERAIRARSRGATNRQRIKEGEFLSFPIELPPLEEQRRIAEILDQADALLSKRRQVLTHLDTLTQSIFHDMFGAEPARARLGDLAEWRSGGTPPRANPAMFEGSIPWFQSGELGPESIERAAEHVSEAAIAQTAAKLIPAGSILVGMYDTAALKSSITAVTASCNQAIAFASIDPRAAATQFVYWAVQAAKPHVLALRRGIRQKNLNLSMVRNIEIPAPPLAKQHEFAARTEQVKGQRETIQRAIAADEELFVSVQSRAFRGELS